jgi:hypothetical protein
VTLDKDARTLSGTFQSQIKDTTDAVLLVVTGDYSATPITCDPGAAVRAPTRDS